MAKTRALKELTAAELEVFVLPEREALTSLCGPLLGVNADVKIDVNVTLGGGCGDGGNGGGGKC